MRIEIDLVREYPHAETVRVSLLTNPFMDLEIQPLGSAVNLMEIPTLAPVRGDCRQ
jgi:Ca2+-dependent lipid-binding protein